MSSPRPSAARIGALGFAAVALGCAAFAAYLVGRLMTAGGYTGERTRPVVVARHDLPAAEPLVADALEVVNWPAANVPDGAAATIEELFPEGKAPVPTAALLKGEPIVPSRLAAQAQGTGLAALLRPGYRAVAVKVDDSVGRAGLVYPGARVDVLATIRDPEGRGPSTRIAVEDARVLAVEAETDVALRKPRKKDESITSNGVDGTVVTLEVKPEDAEVVSLASREGQVDLALRNGTDRDPAATRGATPIQFSAFAPDPTLAAAASAGPAAATPLAQLEIDSPAAQAAAKQGARKGGRRRIEIRASDEPDGPAVRARTNNLSTEIETYHAQ